MEVRFPVKLSPSAIDRYRTCPRRFYLQDVERREVEGGDTTPALVIGTTVHRVLERAFAVHPHQRTTPTLLQLFEQEWGRHRTKGRLPSAAQAHAQDEARKMLEQFGDNFDLRAVAHRLEQRLTLRVPGRLELVTRVDRIDRGRYGLRLIDYKTRRAQLEASDMREDTAALVHLLAATKLASEPVERLSLFYLRTGEEIYWEPEADDVELAGERLKRILERVTTDASFEPTPGAACQSCPFALACDAALATVSAERALRLA